MKRSQKTVGLIFLAIVVGLALYLYAGSSVPVGQLPLKRLTATNFYQLQSEFNAAKESVRVVALLSPT